MNNDNNDIYQHKHQSLGVEWRPAEEEGDHHRNCEVRNDDHRELEQILPSIFITCLLPRA